MRVAYQKLTKSFWYTHTTVQANLSLYSLHKHTFCKWLQIQILNFNFDYKTNLHLFIHTFVYTHSYTLLYIMHTNVPLCSLHTTLHILLLYTFVSLFITKHHLRAYTIIKLCFIINHHPVQHLQHSQHVHQFIYNQHIHHSTVYVIKLSLLLPWKPYLHVAPTVSKYQAYLAAHKSSHLIDLLSQSKH